RDRRQPLRGGGRDRPARRAGLGLDAPAQDDDRFRARRQAHRRHGAARRHRSLAGPRQDARGLRDGEGRRVSKLGEILRTQREKKGITLEQAAADTRIREKFLNALEESDYQSLPGAVYTKGFLRNYAEYLDVDPDELIPLYQRERGQPEPPQTKYQGLRLDQLQLLVEPGAAGVDLEPLRGLVY